MIRSWWKSAFRILGLELRRAGSPPSSGDADPFYVQASLLAGLGKLTDPTILDIGAHTGETVERYRLHFADPKFFCFEPFPDSLAVLTRRYGGDPSVRVIPKAVADSPGSRIFHVNELDSTSSLLPRPKSARRYYPKNAGPKSTINVSVTTIDEFMNSEGIETIDVLKLDIQGGELMAFKGAAKMLRENRVRVIYTETMFVPHYEGNPLFHDLWSFLADFGYTFFDLYHLRRAANGQLRFGDALFIDREIRDVVVDRYQEEP
jgi:FkbM family methyltransferase